jgi:hypothetical protein
MAGPEPTAMLLWLWLQIKSDRRKVKLPFDS